MPLNKETKRTHLLRRNVCLFLTWLRLLPSFNLMRDCSSEKRCHTLSDLVETFTFFSSYERLFIWEKVSHSFWLGWDFYLLFILWETIHLRKGVTLFLTWLRLLPSFHLMRDYSSEKRCHTLSDLVETFPFFSSYERLFIWEKVSHSFWLGWDFYLLFILWETVHLRKGVTLFLTWLRLFPSFHLMRDYSSEKRCHTLSDLVETFTFFSSYERLFIWEKVSHSFWLGWDFYLLFILWETIHLRKGVTLFLTWLRLFPSFHLMRDYSSEKRCHTLSDLVETFTFFSSYERLFIWEKVSHSFWLGWDFYLLFILWETIHLRKGVTLFLTWLRLLPSFHLMRNYSSEKRCHTLSDLVETFTFFSSYERLFIWEKVSHSFWLGWDFSLLFILWETIHLRKGVTLFLTWLRLLPSFHLMRDYSSEKRCHTLSDLVETFTFFSSYERLFIWEKVSHSFWLGWDFYLLFILWETVHLRKGVTLFLTWLRLLPSFHLMRDYSSEKRCHTLSDLVETFTFFSSYERLFIWEKVSHSFWLGWDFSLLFILWETVHLRKGVTLFLTWLRLLPSFHLMRDIYYFVYEEWLLPLFILGVCVSVNRVK